MNVVLYRTTKRDNSTATPDSAPALFSNRITKDVKLKETTDVLNPTFIFKQTGHDGQNYVWAFGRYYWVTDIKYLANELMSIDCRIDPLGSYRGHIRNTSAFVLYDSTPNSEIPDRRLGVRTTPTTAQATTEMPWGFATGRGTKFVAITGDGRNTDNASGTGVYTMDDTNIDKLGYKISDDFGSAFLAPFNSVLDGFTLSANDTATAFSNDINAAADIKEVFQIWMTEGFSVLKVWFISSIMGLFNGFRGLFTGGKALDNIRSAYWLPFDCSDEGTAVSQITLGGYVEDISAKKITNPFKTTVLNVSIPWQYSDWRNVANTEIQLFIPLIGNVNIPASAIKGRSVITLKMNLNMYSGTFTVRVQCGDTTLGSFGANCQMPIMIGSSNANIPAITNTVVGIAGAVAGAATGNAVLTAGSVSSMIASGYESITPINTSVGGIGGGSGNQLGITITCVTICHGTSDAPSDLLPIIGTPTNVLKTLNGTGFCQTMQAHMNMAAVQGESYPTEAEVKQVNSALDSGVFLE